MQDRRLVGGVIIFNACSSTYHHPNRDRVMYSKRDYRGQADYFGVYRAETDGVYLVPVEDVGTRKGFLRITGTMNGQAKKVRWARDFELSKTSRLRVLPTGLPKRALTLLPASPG